MAAPPPEPPRPDADPPRRRDATWLEVIPAVLSSFFGVRKGKAMREDAVSIRPHQVIVVGVIAAAVLVIGLIFFVRFIIRSAGA